MTDLKPENKINFEENLSRLEEIIDKLQNGNCSLEESITLFEKGISYTAHCRKALETAEKRIISLTEAEQEAENID